MATMAMVLPAWAWSDGEPPARGDYYLVVDKSDNTITLFDHTDWVLQWPCTFGSKDLSDKLFQGDRRTPEGRFKITSIYPHKKWNKFMRLNYPTAVDYAKFEERKRKGLIPASAKIGGDIGIHGTWPREEFAVEYLQPWTLGCVSMRNDHLNEMNQYVKAGTQIVIQR